jgi:peptidyl-prolyl cis-trans isomerase C
MQGQLREEIIAREIFIQEAQKLGLEATPDFKDQLELAHQTLLIRELFNDFQKKNPVTDAEAKAEYDKYAAANGGKEYRARHILVEKEDAAKAIIAQLKKGGKFEDIAKKSSKDAGSGAKGGDLDWAAPGNYVPEFSEAMTKLTKGQLTDKPVKSQFGFHIIRLDDVRDVQLPKFDDVKPQWLAPGRHTTKTGSRSSCVARSKTGQGRDWLGSSPSKSGQSKNETPSSRAWRHRAGRQAHRSGHGAVESRFGAW